MRRRALTEADAQRLQAQARGERGSTVAQGNKFHAAAVTVDGIRYGSKREAERAAELQWMAQAGLIADLILDKRQLRYELIVNGIKIGTYEADSRYVEDDVLIIEDVKSKATKTTWYRRAKKLMRACHGIAIREVE